MASTGLMHLPTAPGAPRPIITTPGVHPDLRYSTSPPVASAPTGPSGAEGDSAAAFIRDFLNPWGLGGLADWYWGRIKDGASPAEVYLELRQRPEYAARFPAMATLDQQHRSISEDGYRAYEQQVRDALHLYGVPLGLYDTPDAIARMMIAGVANTEIVERLQIAAAAVYQAPPEVLASLRENYGIGTGDVIAYYLDPDKATPRLQAQYAASQIQAASRIEGVGTTISTAERLANQGITFDQAMAGFGQVRATQAYLTGYGETVSRAQTEGAAFGDVSAQRAVARVKQSRLANFQGGGSALETSQGVTGLGSAATP